MRYTLGKVTNPKDAILAGQEHLFLTQEELETHVLISGSTGSGKSRTATQIAVDAFERGIGVALIDLHGDTADDTAAHVLKQFNISHDSSLLSRLDYLAWTPTFCPRLDPLDTTQSATIHPELAMNHLIAAMEAAVDQFSTQVNSSTQGTESFEGTPRLLRNLRNGLMGCAVPAPNRRLPTGYVHVLFNPAHPQHLALYDKIAPVLPVIVRADFDAIHELPLIKQREQLESSYNRITAFYSSLLRQSFGETSETAPVLNWATNIRKKRLTVVNLRESDYFSHQQGVVLARLLFSQIVETLIRLPREQRPADFLLIAEECGEMLSEPMLRYLGAVRKYGCRMIFCGQDLCTFRRGNLDFVPKLMSQCGTVITFNQRFPADAELFSELIFTGSLDFTPLIHEQEVEGEIEWLQVEDRSTSTQESSSSGTTQSTTRGESNGESQSRSTAKQRGRNASTTSSSSEADGSTTGQSVSTTNSGGFSQSPILEDQKLKEVLHLFNESEGRNESQSDQTTRTYSQSSGEQHGTSESQTLTNERGTNWGESTQDSDGTSKSETRGTSSGSSIRWVHIPRRKREKVETGQLRAGTTAEQLRKRKSCLMELPPRYAIVKRVGKPPVFIRSVDVPDAFASSAAREKALHWFKRYLLENRPYLFVPNLDPKEETRQINAFLQDGRDVPAAPQEFDLEIDEPGQPFLI